VYYFFNTVNLTEATVNLMKPTVNLIGQHA